MELSRVGVWRHVKLQRQEREEVAKEVAAKYVENVVTSDLDYMGLAIERLNALAANPNSKDTVKVQANAALYKACAERLKISGIGVDDKEFTIKWDMGNDDEDELKVIEEENPIDVEIVDTE